ncbi:hypothetical protein J7E93_13665 [Streptomyces sp. ISL-36]|uniref:hypothetical protein n=1 Tax=Streptomyces sp. ISL-36 TaxID=2819182 RepID=UPI001BE7D262|nr:hypothetical protein [Streptomyces sp. ISL-36]MBT2441138.1 hypothetical protein [Streptomyces sp. ISL-36]
MSDERPTPAPDGPVPAGRKASAPASDGPVPAGRKASAPDVRARAWSEGAAAARPNEVARRLRTRALWAGLLLLPATVVAGFLGLASENAGRCLGYGEGCSDTPGWAYLASLAVAATAWIHALCTPDAPAEPTTARKAAFWTLIGAECVFLLLVLTLFG